MHIEFSWIVSCLSWVCASSYFPRETEMAKDAGKSGVRRTENPARRISRYAVYRESFEKAREQPVDFYFNSRRDISFEKLERWMVCAYVSFVHSHAIRARSHGKPRTTLVTCHEFRPRKRGNFRLGQNVLCTFVTARVTFARPSILYRHSPHRLFFPLNLSVPRRAAPRRASPRKLCRFGDRVPQFIFHAWVRRLGASNDRRIEKARHRRRIQLYGN